MGAQKARCVRITELLEGDLDVMEEGLIARELKVRQD